MRLSPVLLLHICSGIVGLLSGAVAVSLRKGSPRHATAGIVFVISMLCLAGSGTYLAAAKSEPTNFLGGALTFYLVATAWMSARQKATTGLLDWGALLVVLAVMAVSFTFGVEGAMSPTGLKYGYSPGSYFFPGSIALIAMIGDVRMLAHGCISGIPRIARHLWRMCFGLFVASVSIFLARQRLFPAVMRRTGMLYVLSFLPLGLMVFWLIRVRVSKSFQGRAAHRAYVGTA
jgi:hypothetical protein